MPAFQIQNQNSVVGMARDLSSRVRVTNIPHPMKAMILSALAVCLSGAVARAADADRPNIIFFFADNLGYGDLGCTGSPLHRTPNVDRLAAGGMTLTSHYASSPVCTPSRASLMTGCYAQRVSMQESELGRSVLQPMSRKGLHPDEITLAELLKTRGYTTTIIGKWHLGDQPAFLPTRQGFDSYFGVPYSDDMTARAGQIWPELPLMRDETVIEAPADRDTLTRRETGEAIRFITANKDRPFFLYLPHAMPGSTRRPFASKAFQGRSANGPYGDAVEELDWSAGEILRTVARLGLDERTLVVWTSDNGTANRAKPWGSNAPMGGWAYSTREGGMRMPCFVRWPGRIPAGAKNNELTTMMDWYVTLAKLAGAQLPADRVIDGRDIWPLLAGTPGAKSPHEVFFYYYMHTLEAVRDRRWKLVLPFDAKDQRRVRLGQPAGGALYDVSTDWGETNNVIAAHPDIVKRLTAMAEKVRGELGDTGKPGNAVRPPGLVAKPTARVLPGR